MEIVFRNPFYLWALIAIPIIILAHFISLSYSRSRALKFANFVALARVSETVRVNSHLLVLFIRILVFAGIVFAISGTTLHYSGSSTDADYVLLIDSSASMLAADFDPTRFEAAQSAALGFVNQLPLYSSVGVVGFSGTSFVHQLPTIDRALVRFAITDLSIMSSGGTAIGDAVITGTNLLVNSAKPRVLILLTDGRSNVGVGTNISIQYANQHNVLIHTIGIGSLEGEPSLSNESVGSLGIRVSELDSLATYTGGLSHYPDTPEDLNQVYTDISRSEKSNASLDLTLFLLLFLLVLLIIEWILINTRYRVIP